jgi:hypothetical protein
MNTINFNLTGGFPLTTRILKELQTAFSIFNALGAIAGDKTIISGCVTTGSLVSPGVVCIDGEVLEFKGGTVQTKVKIIEAIESLLFEDNVSKPGIRHRYVQFGTGVGAMDWADFRRPLETKNLNALVNRIEALEARPLVGNIPVGLVAIWGLPANNIPAGWVEHTALSGRMPIGKNTADADFSSTIGTLATGGSKTKALSVEEMPEHDHAIGNSRRNTGGGSGGDENHPTSFAGTRNHITDKKGGGQAFSIMNPYRVVDFIRYVG